jgi:hypothetical protein
MKRVEPALLRVLIDLERGLRELRRSGPDAEVVRITVAEKGLELFRWYRRGTGLFH